MKRAAAQSTKAPKHHHEVAAKLKHHPRPTPSPKKALLKPEETQRRIFALPAYATTTDVRY
ncbi:hypothetical protein A3850_001830 [Lewinella sp. 4G2]|nr:hypothetical protein A3850_001830 [Lewinella sp. 4G2]